MNTQNEWQTVAVIHNPERLEFWQAVLGGNKAPIQSIITRRVRVPEKGETDAYMLDLNAITAEQREKLIQAIAKRFSIPIDEVEKELDQGVPILAEDVSVSSSDLGLFLSLVMDDDIDGDGIFDDDPYLTDDDKDWEDD